MNTLEKIVKKAIDLADNNIIITDSDGFIIWANQRTFDFTGYSKEELIGNNPSLFRHLDTSDILYKDMWHEIKTERKPWKGLLQNLKKNGESYWEELKITPIEIDEKLFFIGVQLDVTESMKLKKDFIEKVKKIKNR